MLLLFGWVAARLQHNACQIVGNLACKKACWRDAKAGLEPASLRVRIDNITACFA
jgi:hypothetical protein